MLPAADQAFLTERNLAHQVTVEAGMTCVVLEGWEMPAGYSHARVDLLVRLAPGYSDVPPDMWWTSPAVTLLGGGQVEATQVTEHYLGRAWQRWSRHFQPGQWQAGIDGLETYLARVRREMLRSARRPA